MTKQTDRCTRKHHQLTIWRDWIPTQPDQTTLYIECFECAYLYHAPRTWHATQPVAIHP